MNMNKKILICFSVFIIALSFISCAKQGEKIFKSENQSQSSISSVSDNPSSSEISARNESKNLSTQNERKASTVKNTEKSSFSASSNKAGTAVTTTSKPFSKESVLQSSPSNADNEVPFEQSQLSDEKATIVKKPNIPNSSQGESQSHYEPPSENRNTPDKTVSNQQSSKTDVHKTTAHTQKESETSSKTPTKPATDRDGWITKWY